MALHRDVLSCAFQDGTAMDDALSLLSWCCILVGGGARLPGCAGMPEGRDLFGPPRWINAGAWRDACVPGYALIVRNLCNKAK